MRQNKIHFICALPFLCACVWVVGGAAAWGASVGGSEEIFFRHLKEGAQLLKEKKHARAIARFNYAKKYKPDDARVYYWLGLTFSDLGHFSDAADNAEKATLLDKGMADAWLLWGQSLMHLRKWEEARRKLDRAHRLAPDHPLVAFTLGRCYYHGYDNKNMALDFFKKALLCKSDERVANLATLKTQAEIYIGCCYLAKDLPQAAMRQFRSVLQRDRKCVEAWFRLGIAYRAMEYYAEAAKAFQETLRLRPEHFEAHLQLGHLYLTRLPEPSLARVHLGRFYKFATPKDHPWRKKVYEYYANKKEDSPSSASAAGDQPKQKKPAGTASGWRESRMAPPPPPSLH